MRYMESNEIRQMWLDFFKSKGHKVEESVSLIPHNDPSLLWINAGVAGLKDYFNGTREPECKRIVNAQKCIRTNDIENVGLTARHHTLFEMLGNFSIGDYFKAEAIEFAFELLTSAEWFGIPKEKLYMTVYPDDEEAYQKWLSLGVEESHLIKTADNFWEIGEGPCGPDSEIFFDRGSAFGDYDTKAIENDIEQDRYVEIWNIVFSQYNCTPGLARADYPELPQKNIDTGAGLERFCCIMQNTETNFETDLFMPIIKEVEKISGVKYDGQIAFKVISDHVRSVTFAIADGAMLSNEGRGYVLRRILRRAIKHARSLGIEKPFMYNLVDIVCAKMGDFYPNIVKKKAIIKKIIKLEEEKFFVTLSEGIKMLETMNVKKIDGVLAFTLYDTYGFPIELTSEYASENNIEIDLAGFKEEMAKQKERARKARKSEDAMGKQNEEYINFTKPSKFVGYDTLDVKAKVIKVFREGIVFDKTPFYAESGGQMPDKGIAIINGITYEVIDVQKLKHGQFIHYVDKEIDDINVGDSAILRVDKRNRFLTACNHSATHVMFKYLREYVGKHVSQSGSQNNSENLRFDFSNYEPISDEIILKVEAAVKKIVKEDHPVIVKELSIEEAKKTGAIAEFGEKYGKVVRVVDMDSVEIEFCGGTHVKNLKDIDDFAIVSIESKGSGVFRVTALSNANVKHIDKYLENYNNELASVISKAKNLLDKAHENGIEMDCDLTINRDYLGSYQDVINKRNELITMQEKVKELDKELKKALERKALSDLDRFAKDIYDNKLVTVVKDFDKNNLKTLVDALLEKLGKGIVFIANISNNKVTFTAKSNDGTNCGDLVKKAAIICKGNGGGRPNMASAGGKDISKVEEAILKIKEELGI